MANANANANALALSKGWNLPPLPTKGCVIEAALNRRNALVIMNTDTLQFIYVLI